MKRIYEYEVFDTRSYIKSCELIIYMTLEKKISKKDIEKMSVVDTITAAEEINFIMRNAVIKKINDCFGSETTDKEKSAFDEYDIENGYVDDDEQESVWESCSNLINSIVRMAMKVFNDSFSSVMKADIIELIDQIKYEIDALRNEKEKG